MRHAPEEHVKLVALNKKPASDSGHTLSKWDKDRTRILNNGTLIWLYTYEHSGAVAAKGIDFVKDNNGAMYTLYAAFFIDINGYKRPNMLGRDIFKFYLGQDGTLYPAGGKDVCVYYGLDRAYWNTAEDSWGCKDTTTYGVGCAGRISESNWVMNY